MKRKRFFAVLLAAAMVLSAALLAGCGASGSSGGSGSSEQETSAERTSKDSSSKKSNKEKAAKKSGSEKSEKSEKAKSDSAEETKSSSGSAKASSSGTSAKSGSSSSGSGARVRRCTISISAARLKKSSEASSDVKALVPSNGVIMSKRTVRLRSGDTVKSVLHREAGKAGISVATKGGNYVEGIAGIYEFDGGKKSGWMYSVNGTFPNVSYNRYKLKDGDDIAWRYTLDLGNDL